MHSSSKKRIEWFLEMYENIFPKSNDGMVHVLDVGGGDINGTYEYDREKFCIDTLNIEVINGVNIVVKDPYNWVEIETGKYDAIISVNTFQHIEYFWMTMKEIYRCLKNKGFFAMVAPSQRYDGKYPVACWSFNYDGLLALSKWSGLITIDATIGGIPNDYVDDDWYHPLDDAFLIASKNYNYVDPPRLPFQRSYYDYNERFISKCNRHMNQIENCLKDIVSSEGCYILGAGKVGCFFAGIIKKMGIKLEAFIDSYKKGLCGGIGIKKIEDIEKDLPIIVAIIKGDSEDKDMVEMIKKNRNNQIIVISQYFIL